MSEPIEIAITSPAFRGEPGETSPEAVGGWDAEASREYREFACQREMREFADLYGWHALMSLVEDTRAGGGRDQ